MKKLGVCVVGLGFVGGQAHAPSMNKIKNANLVAVCDMNDKLATKYSTKYGCKKYLSTKEALKDPEIEAAVIAVPTPFHCSVAMEFIKAGKHVLLEMPLGINVGQTKKIIAAAKSAKVTLMPSLNFRFAPIYKRVKEMIKKEKVLGKGPVAVHYREYISANLLAAQWPPKSWAWDKQKSGGPLFTLSVWSIDLMRWLFEADLKQLHAVAENHKLKKYDGTHGYMGYAIAEFTNGTITSMEYSGGVCNDQTVVSMELVGENTNLITAIDTHTIKINTDDVHETVHKVQVGGPKVWGHYQMDEHFVSSILKGKAPEITPRDGLIATEAGVKIAKMYRQLK
ncbi:MAG TPA: Gfo/Idh/MocA family oxidoreductase [Nitrospinota bacterium]|nr:Gfo/Idh/MocA family oxidoreductase [Nitrospinota bacterium]|tara:strand:+ start:35704 stop:36717 length:1014 start_codon:yes stop_codon:yes gene_type:complete